MAWNKPSEEKKVERKGGGGQWNVHLKGLVAALIVVVGAGVAAWLLFSGNDGLPARGTRHKAQGTTIREVKPAAAPKAKADVASKVAKPVEEKPSYAYDTNKWDIIDGHFVPKGAQLVRNYLTNKVERVFKYSTDNTILAYLYPQKSGALPPMQPILGGSDKVFLKSLDEPVVINDDDSDKVRAQKELVIVARAQIKERMDAGEKFADILQENHKLMEENAKIRRDAQKELNKIYRDGDLEGAQKYKRVMDVALQQMGIDELKDPKDNPKNARRMKNEQVR